jgi:hypothetical protein
MVTIVSASLIMKRYLDKLDNPDKELVIVEEALSSIREGLTEDELAAAAEIMGMIEDV